MIDKLRLLTNLIRWYRCDSFLISMSTFNANHKEFIGASVENVDIAWPSIMIGIVKLFTIP